MEILDSVIYRHAIRRLTYDIPSKVRSVVCSLYVEVIAFIIGLRFRVIQNTGSDILSESQTVIISICRETH